MTQSRIFLSPPHMSGHEINLIQEVFTSNYVAPLGPMVNRFEEDICHYTGYKYAVALSSGTAAIHLAFLSLGIKPKDHIWSSTLTFIGSVSPIIFCGGIPTFIDASFEDWNIDIDLLEESLKEAAHNNCLPKAIIVTDLYGQPCDHDRLKAVCAPYHIDIVCDSAESLGASYKNTKCYADISTYSFNGNKIITTSGGGMLVSNDKKIIDHAMFLSQQARDPYPYYQHSTIGNNYRMSNVLAAIGVGQLMVLDKRIERKSQIFGYYKENLSKISGITFMPILERNHPNYWLTVICIDSQCGITPEDLRLALEEENIESRPLWKPMHMQPVFSQYRSIRGSVSEKLFKTGLCIPSGSSLSQQDQDRVIEIIKHTLSKKSLTAA